MDKAQAMAFICHPQISRIDRKGIFKIHNWTINQEWMSSLGQKSWKYKN